MFAGGHSDSRWLDIRKHIQNRFKWGSWESKKFLQCGVLIETLDDGSFQLSQPGYLEHISEVQISRARWKGLEVP